MRTVSNYKALLAAPHADQQAQLKALAQAINFDLALPALACDILGPRVAELGKSVHTLDRAEPVRIDTARVKAALAQKWAVPGDNPVLTSTANRVESFFHSNMPELDLGWQRLFTLVDLRGSTQPAFNVTDTNAGITYERILPGGAVKPRREISEATTPVPYLTYGAGLGILDDWLRFQQFWNVEQAVAEFRAKAWDKLAEVHYGLLTAQSTSIDQAFTTDDTTTFNAAAASILRAVRSKGYAAGQNAQFEIVCAPEHLGRILRMLEATRGSGIVAANATTQPLAYSVAGVTATAHVAANDTGYYLVLPGRKLQRGNWMDLQIESQRDIYARAQDWVGTQQFNAIVGDTAQLRRVKYA